MPSNHQHIDFTRRTGDVIALRGNPLHLFRPSVLTKKKKKLIDKDTGRVVASAYLNKMQPALSKL